MRAMTRQNGWIAGIAAVLVAASGCMTCGHSGYQYAREAGPECELPVCQRNGVYVFAMSSLNPVSVVALDGLREQLNRQGFAKVATGQTIHSGWMHREMRRIHDAEPEAQFIVIGFESAAPAAVRLAERSAAEGLAVGGVVVINSSSMPPPQSSTVRVLAIGAWEDTAQGVEAESAPNVATYGLATDTRTVEAVGRLMNEVAQIVPIPSTTDVAEWSYPHAPPMREQGDPALAPEWSFLFDQYAASAPRPPVVNPPVPALPPVAPTTPIQHSGGILKSAIR
jgi:hypothetical protein